MQTDPAEPALLVAWTGGSPGSIAIIRGIEREAGIGQKLHPVTHAGRVGVLPTEHRDRIISIHTARFFLQAHEVFGCDGAAHFQRPMDHLPSLVIFVGLSREDGD